MFEIFMLGCIVGIVFIAAIILFILGTAGITNFFVNIWGANRDEAKKLSIKLIIGVILLVILSGFVTVLMYL